MPDLTTFCVGVTPMFVLRNANMQLTSDQPFQKIGSFINWLPTSITGILTSGGVTVACLGGIYSASAKGGTAIVAAGQSWLGITGALGATLATIAALVAGMNITPILSLTTGSTAAATANLFIYGNILD